MQKRNISLLCFLLSFSLFSWAQIVHTTVEQGEIEGVEEHGFGVFKAIPYAEAPVGKLRWKAPVPKKKWSGVYRTTDFAPMPIQGGDHSKQSEDCLYLSVQTPAKSSEERLPVFVMIHGGGFSGGHYAGTMDCFAQEGIVYCSIEYRLGVLGFLSLPELSKENNGLSGNYGILDQILALRWIHDNIAAFGGDPSKVTICGESAGGISTSILSASPLCKGLFRAAISESVSSFWPVVEERKGNLGMLNIPNAEKMGVEFMKSKGCKNLKELRRLDVAKLQEGDYMGKFWPIVDGYSIADDQYKLYTSGKYNDVDILIGSNSDEGYGFTNKCSVGQYQQQIRQTFGELSDRVLDVYPATNEQETHYALADIFRDGAFAWGTYTWANLQRRTGHGKVYMYYFDQQTESWSKPDVRGAVHVEEMPYIYKWNWGKFSDTEQHMSDIMHRYWINFTKTGDPNGEKLPFWKIYEEGKPTVMIMKDGFHLDYIPNQTQLNLFEDIFQAMRK